MLLSFAPSNVVVQGRACGWMDALLGELTSNIGGARRKDYLLSGVCGLKERNDVRGPVGQLVGRSVGRSEIVDQPVEI